MNLPVKERDQHVSDPAELYRHAARHKEWHDQVLDRGQGLSAKLGLHVVDTVLPTDEDYEQAHKKGGMVLLAPLKGEKRFHEKVNGKYGGDASKMKDVSRASIVVPHPDDIPHITHALRALGMTYAAQPTDRFADPTPAGYGDVQLAPVDPDGHIGELQIHTLDMMRAKEAGLPKDEHDAGAGAYPAGHKLYERLRTLDESDRDFTPEEKAEREHIIAQSNEIYGEAARRMHTRTRGHKHPLEKSLAATVEYSVALMKGFVKGHYRKNPTHRGVHNMSDEKQHPLRAGYFRWDGHLCRMESKGARPQYWNGKHWVYVPFK
jgi:hypothetical protein